MIDVSECVCDADFAQDFMVLRSSGYWVKGVWQSTRSEFAMSGVISPASAKDVRMVPEGDINEELRAFFSPQPIFTTHANNATDSTGGSSDILIWRCEKYRVLSVKLEQDYGYYKALATRMRPD